MPALSQILDDVYKRAILLQRFDAGLRADVLINIDQIARDVVARVAGRKLTDYQAARLDALLADVSALVDNGYKQAGERLDADLRGLAHIEARATRNSISTAYSMATVGLPAPDMLAAIVDKELILGGPAGDWWADQGRAARLSFVRTIRRGMVEGATTDQLRREITQSGAVAARHAEALVRTSVQTVANGARMATYAANDDIVAGLQWLSTLDARTSTTCQARSGLRWTLDGKPHGHHVKFSRPPAHFNCRSTLIPLLDMDEQISGTQASADGPQAAGWSFEDWLRTKSPSEQDAMLGASRARRWRRGDYTLSQLIDQTGRPLTLSELDALTGKAGAVAPPVVKTDPVEPAFKFEEQKTARAAGEWLVANNFADRADYSGIAPEVANAWNRSIMEHVLAFPELRANQRFIGTAQARNKAWYEAALVRQEERLRDRCPGYSDADYKRWAIDQVRKPKTPGRTFAQSMQAGDFMGITVNAAWGKKPAEFIASVANNASTGWLSAGLDGIKSIVDHEMGHQLDALLKLASKPEITEAFSLFKPPPKMIRSIEETRARYKAELSVYGATNPAEFIAEAWAEYCNSKAPRKFARIVGEAVHKYIKELRDAKAKG